MKMKFIFAVLACFILLSACADKSPAATVTSAQDISGKRVGVVLGTAAPLFARAFNAGEVIEFGSADEMMSALVAGTIDCAVADEKVAPELVKGRRGTRVISEPLASIDLSIAVPKEARDLTRDINAALARLAKRGVLKAIADKHTGGRDYEYPPRDDFPENAGTLKLAIAIGPEPYCGPDERGYVSGIDIDVARALCDELGVILEVISSTDDVINTVWTGRADFGMGCLYRTAKHEELVDFSDGYIVCTQLIITRK